MNLNPTANAIQVRLEECLDERLARIFFVSIPTPLPLTRTAGPFDEAHPAHHFACDRCTAHAAIEPSIAITVDLYGHLVPGGNRQAVDRLDTLADKRFFETDSATSAQPGRQVPAVASGKTLNSLLVTRKGAGVDDGFRTRDLRIHNPAL